MLAKLGSFLLVPFLVSAVTDRAGPEVLLHGKESHPVSADQRYVPLALRWRAGVQRAIEAPAHLVTEPPAAAVPAPAPFLRAPAGELPAFGSRGPALLYAFISLQI